MHVARFHVCVIFAPSSIVLKRVFEIVVGVQHVLKRYMCAYYRTVDIWPGDQCYELIDLPPGRYVDASDDLVDRPFQNPVTSWPKEEGGGRVMRVIVGS